MKYLKTYENITKEDFKVGDYVKVLYDWFFKQNPINPNMKNRIGQIVDIQKPLCIVEIDNKEIGFFNKELEKSTKEEYDLFVTTNKYNL